jgi:hypothetical protein
LAVINGNFSVSATIGAYGVYFGSAAAGSTQNINGNFSIKAVSSFTYGIFFRDTPASTRSGTPTFYSNKADSGD